MAALYLISPPSIGNVEEFAQALEPLLKPNWVQVFQLRLKNIARAELKPIAKQLKRVCADTETVFLINDDVKLAGEICADGVHLGQSDMPYDQAREMLGPKSVIGITCHNFRRLGIEAAAAGADYVAFGAFYPSATKKTDYHAQPDLLQFWQTNCTTPCVAIGGITPHKAPSLVKAGADFIAVSSAIWNGANSQHIVNMFAEICIGSNDLPLSL